MRVLLFALLLVLPGCLLEGEDRAFADESARVSVLRVNAYASEEGGAPAGIVETTGVGGEGGFHAFRGTLRVVLERQRPAEPQPTYEHLKDWTVEVEEDDFASPTIPRHRFVVPAADMPEPGTYRVRVSALVDGRQVPEATALFAFPAGASPTPV